MTPKPVVPRARALEDVEFAIQHYLAAAGPDIAIDFIAALEQAYCFVADTPAAGSPRWAHELNLPGLRSKRLNGFPWLVFYMELAGHIDVWRVLHSSRDIPAWVADDEVDDE